MEHVELFGELYYPARSQVEFEQVMRKDGWGLKDYGPSDYPLTYPCLFRIEYNYDSNGADYPTTFCYYEEDIRACYAALQSML